MYKLSTREKVLLYILLLVAILVGGLLLLVQPMMSENLALQDQLSAAYLRQFAMQEAILDAENAVTQRDAAYSEAAAMGRLFYKPMSNTETMALLYGILDNYEITGVNMSLSEVTVKDLSGLTTTAASLDEYAWYQLMFDEIQPAAADENPLAARQPTAQVLSNTVSLTGQGTTEDLHRLLSDLAGRPCIRVESFAFAVDNNFSLTVSVFMLDQVN